MLEDLPKCKDCGRLLRPQYGKAADWPGTVARCNATQCKACRAKELNPPPPPPPPEEPEAALRPTITALNQYIHGRQQRLAKKEHRYTT